MLIVQTTKYTLRFNTYCTADLQILPKVCQVILCLFPLEYFRYKNSEYTGVHCIQLSFHPQITAYKMLRKSLQQVQNTYYTPLWYVTNINSKF